MMRALDLFSAAAGGWSLGLHRAGFITVAACEIIEWRRVLYAENNPHVRLYEDVRALTATRLVSDLGFLPDIIVGSPPCQDISSANTKGKGIDGERSGLYREAIRLVGDCRPRWFAFENSPNLRTRGADWLLDALETLGYACEPCVVGADNVGANHVRKRSWLIGYDPEQLVRRCRNADQQDRTAIERICEQPACDNDRSIAFSFAADAAIQRRGAWAGDGQGSGRENDRHEPTHDVASGRAGTDAPDTDGDGWDDGWCRRRRGIDLSAAHDPGDTAQIGCGSRWPGRCAQSVAGPCQPPCGHDGNSDRERSTEGQRSAQGQRPDDFPSGRFRPDADDQRGAAFRQPGATLRHDADAGETEWRAPVDRAGDRDGQAGERRESADRHTEPVAPRGGSPADADEARQPHGRLESGLRPEEIADDGCGDGRCDDGSCAGQMGGSAGIGDDAAQPWADWNGGLADHLRLDDGLSAWVADTRIALGSLKGTSAASLIVEAFGDAVLPQIPEAIGRAIARTEAALDAVLTRRPRHTPGDEQ